MYTLKNIIATADDFGLNPSVNQAILNCYEAGYINSTSFLTNTIYFQESVDLLHTSPVIKNVGVHVNLAEGRPVSNFTLLTFLNEDGTWNINRTNNKKAFLLNNNERKAFAAEIDAQINKALSNKITINHLDSHYHTHTLPCFYNLFLQAAKKNNLKLRLAQTYNEGNYLKFAYRKYINYRFKLNRLNYTDTFETVGHFLKNKNAINNDDRNTELMLHPDLTSSGVLTDHFEGSVLTEWIDYLKKNDARY